MKKFHILLLFCALLTSVSCSSDKPRVIPKSTLAKIYVEMLELDQLILTTPGIRQQADTSLVYEPIFEKYGYTTDDYRLSVERYMDDPERYSRILRTSVDILEKRIVELKLLLEAQKRYENRTKVEVDFGMDDCDAYLTTEPYIHYYDSLSVEADSATGVYRIVPHSFEEADSLALVRDSIVVETLAEELPEKPQLDTSSSPKALLEKGQSPDVRREISARIRKLDTLKR